MPRTIPLQQKLKMHRHNQPKLDRCVPETASNIMLIRKEIQQYSNRLSTERDKKKQAV